MCDRSKLLVIGVERLNFRDAPPGDVESLRAVQRLVVAAAPLAGVTCPPTPHRNEEARVRGVARVVALDATRERSQLGGGGGGAPALPPSHHRHRELCHPGSARGGMSRDGSGASAGCDRTRREGRGVRRRPAGDVGGGRRRDHNR